MGCDIHLHTEVKINGQWEHYSVPNVSRNYELFTLLAGVRNYEREIEPISEPRGLPDDVTRLTKFASDDWDSDGHSHSWIGAVEIEQVSKYAEEHKWTSGPEGLFWESDEFGFLFGNDWSGFIRYPEDRPKGLEDIRWVFWFDN